MATLNINILARNSASTALGNIRQDINAVGDAAPGASRGLLGMADALGKIGLGVLGLTTLAGALQDVMSSMFAGNAEMERYEVQLGVLLGGADKAKERLAELAEFGAKTPFELPEVVKAEKVLLGFGLTAERALNMTGKSSTDLRTIIGDIAAGTGSSFEEIALQFGKFSSGMTGDVLARFAELGIVTREQLSEMGIQFSKSGELLSPLPDAMKAITQLTEGRFGGMMDKMSMTFEGQMSTLSDNFNAAKRVLMQPLFDVVRDSLGELNGLLSSGAVQDGLASVADTIAGVVSKAIEGGKQLASDLAPAIQIASQVFVAGFGLMRDVALAVWDFIVPKVQTAVTVIQAVIDTAITAASDVWRERGDDILTQAQYIWGEIDKVIKEIAGAIGPWVEEQWGSLIAWVTENWPLIESTIKVVMNQIGQNVQFALGIISAFWKENGDTIKAIVGGAWEILKVIVETAMTWIGGIIKTIMLVINGDFSGAFGEIVRLFQTSGDSWVKIIDIATGGMITKISTFVADAINWVIQVATEWKTRFELTKDAVIASFSEIASRAKGIVDDIKSTIQGFIDKGLEAKQWFENNVFGLKEGISDLLNSDSGPKWLLEKLRDTGSSVRAWFENNVFPFVETITDILKGNGEDSVIPVVDSLMAMGQDVKKWFDDNVFNFRESITGTIDEVWGTVDWFWGKLNELLGWLGKNVFGINFQTSGTDQIPAAGLTLGRSASLAMAGAAGGVQQSAATLRPIEITVVLDGQVVGRAAWNYLKRQNLVGAGMGV